MNVLEAVRALRLALGDTQQQFAHRLGLAISTVVRYELTRPPKGKVLFQFQQLASSCGREDLAKVFETELRLTTVDLAFRDINKLVAYLQEARFKLHGHFLNSSGKEYRHLQKIEIDVLEAYRSIEHALKIASEIDPSVPTFTPSTEDPGIKSTFTPGFVPSDDEGDE